MPPRIDNKTKIMLVLKEIDKWISTKDLADYIGINHKNIGKQLKFLESKKYIIRKTEQTGKVRCIMNKITTNGKRKKLDYTYKEFLKAMEFKDMTQAINENIQNNQVKDLPINQELTDTEKQLLDKGILLNKEKFDKATEVVKAKKITKPKTPKKDVIKIEILTIIKSLPIRDIDAKRLGLNNRKELTQKLISLIFKL